MEQRKNVTEFVLLVLTQSLYSQKILFSVFLLFYMVTILGNLHIVLTVLLNPILDAPMFFFLSYHSWMLFILTVSQIWQWTYSISRQFPSKFVGWSFLWFTYMVMLKFCSFCAWLMTSMWPCKNSCKIWPS